jgi:NitT/TauT family transport system substrate-binding protein
VQQTIQSSWFYGLDLIGTLAFGVADLHWFWAPICSALTCAGGGILLDICTNRPPRVLREDHYEELAALLFLGLASLAGALTAAAPSLQLARLTFWCVLLTLAAVFVTRIGIVRLGWGQPFRLDKAEPGEGA